MQRRQLLASGAAGAAVALAGCGVLSEGDGSDGADDDSDRDGSGANDDGSSDGADGAGATPTATETPTGPPEFEEVTLGVAGDAEVGSELALTVSATNVGGETGTYEGTVERVAGGSAGTATPTDAGASAFSADFAIEDVPPGETGEAEVAGPAFETADDYEFAIAGEDVSETVRVGPASVGVDESHTLDNDLRVTLAGVDFTPGVHYTYEESTGIFSSTERTGLYGTRPDYVLAVFGFEVENVGTDSSSLSADDFEIADGDVVTELGNGAGLSSARDLSGQPLSNVELGAGESTDAWLLVQYSREDAAEGVSVGYQRDAGGTLPEVEWVRTPGDGSLAMPDFSLAGRDTPAEVEVGSDPEYTFTVANDGDAAGTFRGVLQYRFSSDEGWTDWKPVSAEIDAGGTAEASLGSNRVDLGTVHYRLQPVDETFDVQFVPARRGLGETFTTPRGLEVAVTEVQSADEITVSGFLGDETRTAGEGQQYVISTVEVTRPDQDAPSSLGGGIGQPDNDNFLLRTGDDSYSHDYSDGIAAPVSGSAPGDVSLDAGQTETTYAYHRVPDSVDPESATIRWEDEDGNTAAEWTA